MTTAPSSRAGGGRELEEGAVAGLALDGGVDSLVGLHVVVAPGSTPLSEDHSLVTASLPMPRGDRVLVTGVDGRRVRKSALGLDEDGRDTILAELTNGADGPVPFRVELKYPRPTPSSNLTHRLISTQAPSRSSTGRWPCVAARRPSCLARRGCGYRPCGHQPLGRRRVVAWGA